MTRRKFIRSGSFFVPAIFIPSVIRAQMPLPDSSTALLAQKSVFNGGANTWTPSLISRWRCDTSTVVMLNDSFGTNTLTNGSAGWTAGGKIGGASDFSAASIAYMTIASNATVIATGTDFTWAFWCKGVGSPAPFFPQLVWKSDGASIMNYAINFDNDALTGHFQMNVGNSTTTTTAISTITCGTAAFHLVIGWYTVADKKCHISVDNETAVDSAAHTGSIPSTTAALTFGSNSPAFTTNAPVLFDDCSFWKRALTSGERSSLWNSGAGFDYPLT